MLSLDHSAVACDRHLFSFPVHAICSHRRIFTTDRCLKIGAEKLISGENFRFIGRRVRM